MDWPVLAQSLRKASSPLSVKGCLKRASKTFGGRVEINYRRGYPVTANAPEQAAYAAEVATDVLGADRVDANVTPKMGGEDFSYMLLARPGAYAFLGNGPTSELHSDTYDFNDEIIPAGVSYLVRLVESASR